MLELTPDATQFVARLLSEPEIPAGAGVRIETAETPEEGSNGAGPEAPTLRMVIVPEASGADQVVEQERARIFIGPEIVDFLDHKVLDIAADGPRMQFVLAEQE
jgi:hypothetical protein